MKLTFRTKLILFIAALLCAVQIVDLASIFSSTRDLAFEQARKQLSTATEVFHRQFEDRTTQLVQRVQVLTLDFGFRETVAVGDVETQRSAILNLGQRVGADRLMLVSLDDEIIIDTAESNLEQQNFPFSHLIDKADQEGIAADIVALDGRIYRVVMVPVLAPLPIAWIGIGIEINDVLANKLAEFAALPLQLSFTYRDNAKPRIIGSNATSETRAFLMDASEKPWMDSVAANIVTVGEELFAIVGTPLLRESTARVVAVLQYSVQDAIDQTQPLLVSIVILLVLGLGVALIGGIFIARGVSRPLSELVSGISRVSQGDYARKIAFSAENEFGELANTFNDMMDGIRDREAKITYQATFDDLTGLPNRAEFSRRVQQAITGVSEGQTVTVIVAGLGRLEEVRETLGYSMGDRFVQQLSARFCTALATSLPGESVVSRVDGDSIGLLYTGSDQQNCLQLLESIVQAQREPVSLGDFVLATDLRYGVAFRGQHGDTAEALIRRAEIAMHKAASAGASSYVFSAETDEPDPERLLLIGELREAITKGQLELFYQPKLDARTGRTIGAEGLSRWRHPERGLVSPGIFIPLAEQTGDIRLITEWSVNQAIDDVARWHAAGYELKVSVNLTVYDLTDRVLLETLKAALARTEVAPKSIILEITESGIMSDPDMAISVLHELAAMGFGLSIDDYGTGYSSMSYLKSLPVTELKIDQSFVKDIAIDSKDEVIVSSTRELAHSLGLSVTAEGVEDVESYDVLKRLGCDVVQGYFFSRPVPREEFEAFLEASQWGATPVLKPDCNAMES